MDLASTRNPVHWTSGPVAPADSIIIRGRFAFTLQEGFADNTLKLASSIDSLVRVSRRAEGDAAAPSFAALLYTKHHLGGRGTRRGHQRAWWSHHRSLSPSHGWALATGASGDAPGEALLGRDKTITHSICSQTSLLRGRLRPISHSTRARDSLATDLWGAFAPEQGLKRFGSQFPATEGRLDSTGSLSRSKLDSWTPQGRSQGIASGCCASITTGGCSSSDEAPFLLTAPIEPQARTG